MTSAPSLLTESSDLRAWDAVRLVPPALPLPPDPSDFVLPPAPTQLPDHEVERRLAALARARGPLRRALAAVARRIVESSAHEKLGFARLRDFAMERVGLSARSLQDLARVDGALARLPGLEAALVGGWLSWTKVRLLARVATPEDEEAWVEHAIRVSSRELARDVRAVDREETEPESDEDGVEEAPRERIEIHCRPAALAKWFEARRAARRVAGERLPGWACLELVAAEVISAIGVDREAEDGKGAGEAALPAGGLAPANGCALRLAGTSDAAWLPQGSVDAGDAPRDAARDELELPPEIDALLAGLPCADPFELDARLRRAVELEQGLDAQIGPLLRIVARRGLHRARGLPTFEAYARERLGISPRKARALLRLERAADRCPDVTAAYREGRISWVQAHAIAPLLFLEGASFWGPGWVERAEFVSVRRLEDDVEGALLLAESDPETFRLTGGVPAWEGDEEAAGGVDAEASAKSDGDDEDPDAPEAPERQTGARPPSGETCRVSFGVPPDVARLFRAALSGVRRRIEERGATQVTAGDVFEAMLDHALAAWEVRDPKLRADHRIFERDGWRCQFPGCSSLRNLHDHHIWFRSAGGGDDLANRLTLCAWHHLRGVHARIVRVLGRAPAKLRFELGVRREGRPLEVYGSGDVRVFE